MYLDLISRIYHAHESQLARNVCLGKVKTLSNSLISIGTPWIQQSMLCAQKKEQNFKDL